MLSREKERFTNERSRLGIGSAAPDSDPVDARRLVVKGTDDLGNGTPTSSAGRERREGEEEVRRKGYEIGCL